jgi:hypothetical protein
MLVLKTLMFPMSTQVNDLKAAKALAILTLARHDDLSPVGTRSYRTGNGGATVGRSGPPYGGDDG